MKRIFFYAIQFLLIPVIAFAAGRTTVSTHNLEAHPISGV
jgi:hypothetical protein